MANKTKKRADRKVERKLDELQRTVNRAHPGEATINSGKAKKERWIQGGDGGPNGGGGGRKRRGPVLHDPGE